MNVLPAVESLRRSAREPEAFVDFYRAHYDRIVAYFARRVYDAEVALDLTAETFAQAYIQRARFRGNTAPEAEAWLYRIAQGKLAHYLRRGIAERKALQRLRIQAPPVTVAQRDRVEELADLEGLRSVLRSELVQLSDDQRQALLLRVVEDLSYADVARRLAISEQAARARVSRGLKVLAQALDGNELVTEDRR